MIKCACKNILEGATVVLSAGAAAEDYPLYRLYDRDIGRVFRSTAAETIGIKVDQGAFPESVDRLLIPAGHKLAGMTLDIEHSDDDSAYTPATAQWTGEAGLINKLWSPVTKRYWRLTVTNPPSVPEMAELFLTGTYEWERNPARPAGPFDPVFNVEHMQTAAGHDRFLNHGAPKRQRVYHMPRCREAQKDGIDALNDAWAGSKPFWLEDHEGAWIYGRLRGPLNLREVAHHAYSFDFDFLEVLP